MHPNPAFRKTDKTRTIEFARHYAFGALSINASNGPLLSHIPFLLSDDASMLEAHLVRSNPIIRALSDQGPGPIPAVLAVQGAHSYVSPDWYKSDNLVPTWNYIAVHLRGRLRRLSQDDLPRVLERISENMEMRLSPKPVWTMDKVNPDMRTRMMRQIVPIALDITTIDSTWKLGQNKPDAARMAAADGVFEHGFGSETQHLAALMREPLP